MLNHDWEFDGLTTAAEAAEHLTLFALTKLGIDPANQDPATVYSRRNHNGKIKDHYSPRGR